MKKILCLFFVMLMVLSSFACTSAAPAAPASDSSAPAAQAGAEPKEEVQEIVTLRCAFPQRAGDMDAEVQAAINEYLAQHGLAIDFTYIPAPQWREESMLLYAGGELDVAIVYQQSLSSFAANGTIIPLDELVANDANASKYFDLFTKEQINCGYINGELYGMTTARDLASAAAVIFRKDQLDSLNVKVEDIKTLEDLHDVLVLAKAAFPDMAPLAPVTSSIMLPNYCFGWDNLGDELGLGVILNPGESTEVVNLYASEQFKYLADTFHAWYQEGLILEDAMSNTESIGPRIVAETAFCGFQPYHPGTVGEQTSSTGHEIVAAVLTNPLATTSTITNLMYGVSSSCENPEAAMKLIGLMYTDPELMTLLVCGIEGKIWEYANDEKTMMKYCEGIDPTALPYKANGYAYPNQYLTPVKPPQAGTYFTDLAAFNNNAVPSKALGFLPDGTEVADEIAACSNVVAKYRDALLTGSVAYDAVIGDFLAELEAAGINDIIESRQSQLDAWLAG